MLIVSVFAGMGVSCKKEMFNEQTYNEILDKVSPVDSVDPNHKWELSTTKYLLITANAGVGTQKVQILNADPAESTSSEVLSQVFIKEGEKVGLNVSYPSILTTLYAAAVDEAGNYTIVSFKPSNRDVDFSNPIHKQVKLSTIPGLFYYSYCFEHEFPEPGDYDYNDVVLHIALERAAERLMKIHVRLAAVGATLSMASCISLPDYPFNDIDSIYTVGDQSFNKGIKQQYMTVLDKTDLLLEGLSGEAVINLFADAHWATGDILEADNGIIKRKTYNVVKPGSTNSDNQIMVPREITYVIRVKDDNQLNGLAMDRLDPFIIRLYGNARMEIHTYNYCNADLAKGNKHAQVLYNYTYSSKDHLPWALKVPMTYFNHPTEGVNMGFRMKDNETDILFGAYDKQGHSFGEWSMDRNKCLDWYGYPNESNVFVW